jgi:hypothetical protein
LGSGRAAAGKKHQHQNQGEHSFHRTYTFLLNFQVVFAISISEQPDLVEKFL